MSEREPQSLTAQPQADGARRECGSAAPSRSESAADLTPDEERELMALWLSRVMFGQLVDPALAPRYVEARTFEQFRAARLTPPASRT